MRSVSETRVFSIHSFIHATDTRRMEEEILTAHGKRAACACARAALTCPCCSAVPPLLDCSPWTDSCCCIHSSVSLQERKTERYEDSLLRPRRLTDRRNFSWETAGRPPPPPLAFFLSFPLPPTFPSGPPSRFSAGKL